MKRNTNPALLNILSTIDRLLNKLNEIMKYNFDFTVYMLTQEEDGSTLIYFDLKSNAINAAYLLHQDYYIGESKIEQKTVHHNRAFDIYEIHLTEAETDHLCHKLGIATYNGDISTPTITIPFPRPKSF